MRTPGIMASSRRREIAILVLICAPLAVLLAGVAAIPQDPAYHGLADTRTLLGIPSFMNVVSNVGFLIVGLPGLQLRGHIDGAATSWRVFFWGILAIAFGSAYYHLRPENVTLVWDRLPMTIAFMALLSGVVAEHLRADIERRLLPVALAVGIISVAWWYYADDLRLYAWVQFAPFVAIAYVLLACPARYSHRHYLAAGFAAYALAKVAELGDAALFAATSGLVSGHSLKHVLAALAPFFVYLMLARRRSLA